MSFSYDVATTVGKVRMWLGDTVSGSGPKPDGTNLSDEEIAALLEQENNHIGRTVAACCEMLANAWASVATIRIGPRSEDFGAVSEGWARRARQLRAQYGGAAMVFSTSLNRNDGYAAAAEGYT